MIDTILGRIPLQSFDTNLLSYDDGDGFSFLEDWYHGANPYNPHTFDPEIEDEVYVRRKGMVVLAQPPIEVYRYNYSEGGAAIVLAQPPIKILRTQTEGGYGVVLANPPVQVSRNDIANGPGIMLSQPPVQIIRSEMEEDGRTGGNSLEQISRTDQVAENNPLTKLPKQNKQE